MAGVLNPGLCATCEHAKILSSDRGSTFYRCGLSDTDPRFRRYPALPVMRCEGYRPDPAKQVGT
jgi:hypothetical protein